MKRLAEIAVFLGLSAAVHAGVMAGIGPGLGGPQGQGAAGDSMVTLAAAPEALSALARQWQAPPTTMPAPAAPTAPTLSEIAPILRDEPAIPTLSRPLQPALPVPDMPADPLIGAAPPPPPPPPVTALAAAQSPRPAQRPERPAEQGARPATTEPAPPRQPQPARQAAGAGGGATQGASPAPSAAAPAISAATRQSLMGQWGAQIMARIERARPRVGARGQVVLALAITRDGQLAGLSVSRSSGDPALDAAALSAVQRAGRFPAAPAGLTDARYSFSLPIRFR
jgi:protein TonB